MSNIYIQEPPTNGKVILKTTIGEIEVELWSKETPKSCRNFIQLCMEGYYNGTVFHRIIKDFIAQGGDPTGTGEGGESIYGEPFKDEFHSRLRFNRRGLLAMANAGPNDNGSQFFFTLGACPELQNKHTIFGRVGGQTIYNMIKLNECELIDERPVRAERILTTEVIYNPFEDIVPRNKIDQSKKQDEEQKKNKSKGVKNFSLLSFGGEAEEDQEELETVIKVLKPKAKSAHDVGDPTLLAKKAIETMEEKKRRARNDSDESQEDEHIEKTAEKTTTTDLEGIKAKLTKKKTEEPSKIKNDTKKEIKEPALDAKELKKKQTQEEIRQLERELLASKKQEFEDEQKEKEKKKEQKEEIEVVKKYKEDVEKYEHLKKKKLKQTKEDKTFELLNSFRNRVFKAKVATNDEENTESMDTSKESKEDDDIVKEDIFTHKLELEEEVKQKVIDANIADHERYDVYDPRNPINKRKREESKQKSKEKKSTVMLGGSSKYSI